MTAGADRTDAEIDRAVERMVALGYAVRRDDGLEITPLGREALKTLADMKREIFGGVQ